MNFIYSITAWRQVLFSLAIPFTFVYHLFVNWLTFQKRVIVKGFHVNAEMWKSLAYLSIVAAIRSVYTRETAGRLVIQRMFFSVYERRWNESEKRRSRPRCTCSSEEINEHILAIPTCPARLRFSLSLSLFVLHRRSILLPVLLSISSLSLSQILIYGRVINSRLYSSLCTTTETWSLSPWWLSAPW